MKVTNKKINELKKEVKKATGKKTCETIKR